VLPCIRGIYYRLTGKKTYRLMVRYAVTQAVVFFLCNLFFYFIFAVSLFPLAPEAIQAGGFRFFAIYDFDKKTFISFSAKPVNPTICSILIPFL
jgi:hypothetical protein